MSRSKRIFFLGSAVFALLLAYASYDISRKTTFPGSKPQLRERIQRDILKDSTQLDSVARVKKEPT
jgi:hypothetical protein